MLRLSVVALSVFVLAAAGHRSAQRPGGPVAGRDTVQAGDAVVDAARLKPFALLRELTLTRGDTVKPFGRQSEELTSDTLDGRPVLLPGHTPDDNVVLLRGFRFRVLP